MSQTTLPPLKFPTPHREPVSFDTLPPAVRQSIDNSFLDGNGLSLVDELAGVGDDADCVRHVRFWQREIAAHRAAAVEKRARQ